LEGAKKSGSFLTTDNPKGCVVGAATFSADPIIIDRTYKSIDISEKTAAICGGFIIYYKPLDFSNCRGTHKLRVIYQGFYIQSFFIDISVLYLNSLVSGCDLTISRRRTFVRRTSIRLLNLYCFIFILPLAP